MVLPIVEVGHPVLRQRARPLTPDEIRGPAIRDLIDKMRETMREAPGVGLAAPQIGESLQLAVIEDRPSYLANTSAERLALLERTPVPFHVVINPTLTLGTDTKSFFEGCLSFPGFLAVVARARDVRVDALNEKGNPIVIDAHG